MSVIKIYSRLAALYPAVLAELIMSYLSSSTYAWLSVDVQKKHTVLDLVIPLANNERDAVLHTITNREYFQRIWGGMDAYMAKYFGVNFPSGYVILKNLSEGEQERVRREIYLRYKNNTELLYQLVANYSNDDYVTLLVPAESQTVQELYTIRE